MGKLPVPMPPPLEMLRRRMLKMRRHQRIWTLFRVLCLMGLVAAVVFSQFFLIHRNQGLGMFPTARDGDLVLARRGEKNWQKNDLVIFRLEGETHMGRIVAQENDEVMMDSSGLLLVNGTVQNELILYPTYARENARYPQRMPEGRVCILGDHRTQCRDSRDHGYIPVEDIMGKVVVIIRTGDL